MLERVRCPFCSGELVDKGHGPAGYLMCRDCLADVPRGSFHAPSGATRLNYPGGKDGWFRVDCLAAGCEYEATEARPDHAINRVWAHAQGKGPRP